MKAIGSQVQAFAQNKKSEEKGEAKSESNGDDEHADGEGGAAQGNGIRKKMLGERGHGPRLRGGSSQMQP